jgi:NitT/TauT family transport system ATP-binding protein
VVFITHDIEEAIFLSQRIYVMEAHPGRIKQEIIVPAAITEQELCKDSTAFIQLKKQIVALIGEHN